MSATTANVVPSRLLSSEPKLSNKSAKMPPIPVTCDSKVGTSLAAARISLTIAPSAGLLFSSGIAIFLLSSGIETITALPSLDGIGINLLFAAK